MSEALTSSFGEAYLARKEERDANGHLEWAIEQMRKGLTQFRQALREVHARKSYRFKHASFGDFCRDELHISEARGYQIVASEHLRTVLSEQTADNPAVSTVVEAMPETHLRELAKTTPEHAVEVLTSTLVEGGGKTTAKRLREAIRPETKRERPVKRCPHCGEEL